MSSIDYPADDSPFLVPADPGLPGLPDAQAPAPPAPLGVPEPAPAPVANLHELRLDEASADVQQWSQQSQYQVIVRLTDGDSISVGAFADSESAEQHAREVVRYVANIPGGEWPFFGGRYLRPELIASVDLVERRSMSWTGNEARFQWATGA